MLVVGNASMIDLLLYAIAVGKTTVNLAWGRQSVGGPGPRLAPNSSQNRVVLFIAYVEAVGSVLVSPP